MRTVDMVLAWALAVLGIIHSAVTFTYRPFSMGTVWFFSGGAALIMAGLMNVSRIRRPDEFTRAAALVANLLVMVTTLGVTWFARHRLGGNPQLFAVWVASVGELLFSMRGRR